MNIYINKLPDMCAICSGDLMVACRVKFDCRGKGGGSCSVVALRGAMGK